MHTCDRELSDHVTTNYSGHVVEMPVSDSRHLEPLKGLGGGGEKGLNNVGGKKNKKRIRRFFSLCKQMARDFLHLY